MKIYAWFLIAVCLTACTYNIIQTSTHGEASDVVDETSTANADLKPNLTIPVK